MPTHCIEEGVASPRGSRCDRHSDSILRSEALGAPEGHAHQSPARGAAVPSTRRGGASKTRPETVSPTPQALGRTTDTAGDGPDKSSNGGVPPDDWATHTAYPLG